MSAVLESSPKTEVFTPPAINIGDTVKWLDPGSQNQWRIALVQRVNYDRNLEMHTVGLTIIPPPDGLGGHNMLDQTKVSVLHVLDPRINEGNRAHFGAWDLTEGDKARRREMVEVKEAIAALKAKTRKE